MAAPPPIPARPNDLYEPKRQASGPPIPPLPPGFRVNADENRAVSPMIAPRPQKNFSNAPAEMAQSLEAHVGYLAGSTPPFPTAIPNGAYRGPSPAPPLGPGYISPPNARPMSTVNPYPEYGNQSYGSPPPIFHQGTGSSFTSPSNLLPPSQYSSQQNGSNYFNQTISVGATSESFTNLNVQQGDYAQRRSSFAAQPPASKEVDVTAPAVFRPELIPFAAIAPRPRPGEPPVLTVSLPTIESLSSAASSVASSYDNPARQLGWSKQVLNLIERTQAVEQQLPSPRAGGAAEPSRITNPQLITLANQAIQQIISVCQDAVNPPYPPYIAEALYLRGTLAASGSFPTFVEKDLRTAFKDFETAARSGYHTGWFKIGRDYEAVNDARRARDAFQRGVRLGEKSCLYRMGMAHLQGQLEVTKDPELAIPLLKQSADISDVEAPQAAYVFGMLLLGEFTHVEVPSIILMRYLPRASPGNPDPRLTEAKRYIERAAYLNFAPAQIKSGWAHEFARMGCAYDPLLSVQYYSLASQQGEEEADMALSKWFLCGADGYFEKDEALALTFAEKAARKGLPTAEFAMGYYSEVGVGGRKDVGLAKAWYSKAASHNNADAAARLRALAESNPAELSREQHETLTQNKLVRKRTRAQETSVAAGRRAQGGDGRYAVQVAQSAVTASGFAPPAGGQAPAQTPPGHVSGRPSLQYQAPPSGVDPRRSAAISPISDPAPRRSSSQPPRPQQQPPPPQQPAYQRPIPSHAYTSSNTTSALNTPSGTPPPPKKGPATFEEMGYQSQALDQKECVIM